MQWTAVIPLKAEPLRKSRLAPAVDAERRVALSHALYRHVVDCVSRAGLFEDGIVLSPSPPLADAPVRWWDDEGRPINAALARVREAIPGHLVVINADLPLLEPADLVALAEAAAHGGCAVAADRHGSGTNAIALLPGIPFTFSFGPDSLHAHLHSAGGDGQCVQRPGLAHDIDTLADIDALFHPERPIPPDIARWLQALERCS